MSQELRRCSPFINGTAYCGMLAENERGSFGPDFVLSQGPYYVAADVDREIAWLRGLLEEVSGHKLYSRHQLEAENERLRERLQDCETGLETWDSGHESEYWLRHQIPAGIAPPAETATPYSPTDSVDSDFPGRP